MPRYKPIQFFSLALLITWIFGFINAYFSYQRGMQYIEFPLMIPYLLAPFIVALIMFYRSNSFILFRDFFYRLKINLIKPNFLLVIFVLMPLVVIISTLISLTLGQSLSQFKFSNEFHVLKGQWLYGFIILIIGPIFEEFGWRGYGVDSLRSKFNLFNTSILFGILWGLFHLPLFFVKGYYHHELWQMNFFYVINFFVSTVAIAFLINWIYYKNQRSIIAAILFHLVVDFSSELLKTQQFTKCIVTILLIILTIVIVIKDKKFFFTKDNNWLSIN